jgi:hypothetical protein
MLGALAQFKKLCPPQLIAILAFDALVAQLDRASAFEAEGREFESLRARHFSRVVPCQCLYYDNGLPRNRIRVGDTEPHNDQRVDGRFPRGIHL